LLVGRRNPLLVIYSVADILRARVLAIACGYEDDFDYLRTDPGFKLAADASLICHSICYADGTFA
jgi:hypothetical protein